MRKVVVVLLLGIGLMLVALSLVIAARRAFTPLGPPQANRAAIRLTPAAPTATPPAACIGRVQALVDTAQPGATVRVPACLYRETVRITKPLTLDGQGQAEIRGSDIWTGWTDLGGFWVSRLALPVLPTDGNPDQCQPNTGDRCLHAEQVFLDGRPLAWVASNPQSGQFALDSSRNVILADDPTGRTVEVTTRQRWADIQADHVTIQGFTMRHAASAPNVITAIGNQGHTAFTLQDNILSDAHGSIISIDGGSGARVLRNDVSRGGQLGISGWNSIGALIQGNKIHDNMVDAFSSEWAAGGLKVTSMTNLTLDSNELWNNAGPALWCDISCRNITISNNRIHNNPDTAIFFEISDGAVIYNNAIWDSGGGASIAISSSGNVNVYNNTIIGSPRTSVWMEDRARPDTAGTYAQIHDNVAIAPTDGVPVSWWRVTPGTNGNVDQNNVILTGSAAADWIVARGLPSSQ